MVDLNAMFGAEPREEKEADDASEGFATGQKYAGWIEEEIGRQFGTRSRAYREGIVNGILDAFGGIGYTD